MEQRKRRGAITVFICIVLSAVFLVIGTFSDGARLRLAQSQVQRAGKSALSSLLANYNNELKDEYGLFGVYLDGDTLQETFEEYFSKNLGINEDGKSMYDFSIDNTLIEQPYSLENRNIFENQIMEFMKYRAPYELASELIGKVNGIKNISSGSKIFGHKMQTDKQAAEIGKIQLSLENVTRRINGSEISAQLSTYTDEFTKQNEELDEKIKSLQNLQSLYSGETNQGKKQLLFKDLTDTQNEIDIINKTKNDIRNNILEVVGGFKSLNSEAINEVALIDEMKKALSDRIDGELHYLEDNQDGIREIQDSYENSLDQMKSMLGQDNSNSIAGGLQENIKQCDDIINSIESNDEVFLSSLERLVKTDDVAYTYSKTPASGSSSDKDNRGNASEELKNTFKKDEDSKKIPDDLLEFLPSRKADFEEETEVRTWDNMDFDDESCAIDNFNYIAEKESIFGDITDKVSEGLYTNEYIMGTFKHDVPLLKGQTEKDAYNLRSRDKAKRTSFFSNCEVEYIINGNRDEKVNSMLTKSEILAIRLIANVLHIYADSSKMTRVTSLAAALSAWCAGLATPLIQTMLIFSWATLEALYDIKQLEAGEKVMLFKTKDQWMTDISGIVSKKEKSNVDSNPLYLSYHDYLKIFLVTMDKDKKLARVQDLVQLNKGTTCQGFLLDDCKVFLKADATVSIKNLFVSLPVFAANTRRNISRSYVKESVYLGY